MTDLAALLKYAEQFRRLHTSFTQANNQAPHKFILLCSLCLLYESGSLHAEQIDFTGALLDEWQEIFGWQWRLWVANEYHRENFGMPLYHMKTEPFWHFCVKPGMEDVFEQKNRMKVFYPACAKRFSAWKSMCRSQGCCGRRKRGRCCRMCCWQGCLRFCNVSTHYAVSQADAVTGKALAAGQFALAFAGYQPALYQQPDMVGGFFPGPAFDLAGHQPTVGVGFFLQPAQDAASLSSSLFSDKKPH